MYVAGGPVSDARGVADLAVDIHRFRVPGDHLAADGNGVGLVQGRLAGRHEMRWELHMPHRRFAGQAGGNGRRGQRDLADDIEALGAGRYRDLRGEGKPGYIGHEN